MNLLVEMIEKKDYENVNRLCDNELKKLFANKIRLLFSEESNEDVIEEKEEDEE